MVIVVVFEVVIMFGSYDLMCDWYGCVFFCFVVFSFD